MSFEVNGATDALHAHPARIVHAKPATTRSTTSVVTRMLFAVPPERVWSNLLFFEHIRRRPPLHLRLLLPIPIGTEGAKSQVGNEVRCLYERGHLIKRITHIEAPRRYEFEVIEQQLRVCGGLALIGGCYLLRSLEGGGTEVSVTTQYMSGTRFGLLWTPIEAMACHMFHRHLLSAMKQEIESAAGLPRRRSPSSRIPHREERVDQLPLDL